MALPMRFSGGDQVVDGGNQQRRADDAAFLRFGEEGFQPCGQGPVSAGSQGFRFRRVAVIIRPRCGNMFLFFKVGSIEKRPRHVIADDRGEIAVGKAKLTLQGPPRLQRKATQVQGDGKPGSGAAGEDAGRAHVHARLAAAGSRHVENKEAAFGIRFPGFGQRLSRRILPCETAFRSRRAQDGLQRAGLQPCQGGFGTFRKIRHAPDHIRRFFRNAGQMVGKALIQTASIGCGIRIGEGGGNIVARRAFQRRYRVIRKDKSRACIKENGPPIRNPPLARHSRGRFGKALVQPVCEFPKGIFRIRPRSEKGIIGRAAQVFPYEPSSRAGQARGEQSMMCGNKRIHAFLRRGKSVGSGIDDFTLSKKQAEACCVGACPRILPVHPGSQRLPQLER